MGCAGQRNIRGLGIGSCYLFAPSFFVSVRHLVHDDDDSVTCVYSPAPEGTCTKKSNHPNKQDDEKCWQTHCPPAPYLP